MIFAVFDPSPLTVCINCSFLTFICYSYGADKNKKKQGSSEETVQANVRGGSPEGISETIRGGGRICERGRF